MSSATCPAGQEEQQASPWPVIAAVVGGTAGFYLYPNNTLQGVIMGAGAAGVSMGLYYQLPRFTANAAVGSVVPLALTTRGVTEWRLLALAGGAGLLFIGPHIEGAIAPQMGAPRKCGKPKVKPPLPPPDPPQPPADPPIYDDPTPTVCKLGSHPEGYVNTWTGERVSAREQIPCGSENDWQPFLPVHPPQPDSMCPLPTDADADYYESVATYEQAAPGAMVQCESLPYWVKHTKAEPPQDPPPDPPIKTTNLTQPQYCGPLGTHDDGLPVKRWVHSAGVDFRSPGEMVPCVTAGQWSPEFESVTPPVIPQPTYWDPNVVSVEDKPPAPVVADIYNLTVIKPCHGTLKILQTEGPDGGREIVIPDAEGVPCGQTHCYLASGGRLLQDNTWMEYIKTKVDCTQYGYKKAEIDSRWANPFGQVKVDFSEPVGVREYRPVTLSTVAGFDTEDAAVLSIMKQLVEIALDIVLTVLSAGTSQSAKVFTQIGRAKDAVEKVMMVVDTVTGIVEGSQQANMAEAVKDAAISKAIGIAKDKVSGANLSALTVAPSEIANTAADIMKAIF